MKHSYIRYAAISEDGESIFQYDHAIDQDSGEWSEWFDAWSFDPEIIAECAYVHSDILKDHLKENNCAAKIKKYKITVEELREDN